mmetsp:Transcript_37737/g.85126  ORF Transcript_37737/g.85126 Transcript_37737/m.85126 type:complete len:165 (+) Transcript_37737:120-614(+)
MPPRQKLRRLNWERGTSRFGDEGLYREALAEYPRVLLACIDKIQAAHRSGDHAALRDSAWRVQGGAAYVAADQLHGAAVSLISSLDSGGDARSLVLTLADEARALCEELRGPGGISGPPPEAATSRSSSSDETGPLRGQLPVDGESGVPKAGEQQAKRCTCTVQ